MEIAAARGAGTHIFCWSASYLSGRLCLLWKWETPLSTLLHFGYMDMLLHDCSGQREAAFFLLFCLMGIDFFVMISLPDGLRKKYDDHSDED